MTPASCLLADLWLETSDAAIASLGAGFSGCLELERVTIDQTALDVPPLSVAGGTLRLQRCLVASGGALQLSGGMLQMDGTTVRNQAGDDGGANMALYLQHGTLLAEHCLEEFVRDNPGCDRRGFSPEAMVALKGYEWPGNVRQLRNAVERACTMGSGDMVLVQHLSADVQKGGGMSDAAEAGEDGRALGSFQEMKARKLAAIETTYVADLLRRHEGNVTRSAEEAGMTHSAFQKLMQRYNIKSSEFRR